MARTSTPTLLPLENFAKTMLLNPMHWNSALAPEAHASQGGMMPREDACSEIWWQHPWQNQDAASRETIAEQIAVVEEEIAEILKYYPAPRWHTTEEHIFPQTFDPSLYSGGHDLRGQRKLVKTKFGKLIAGGPRTVSLVGTATVAGVTLVYSDTNSYEFSNLATITLPTSLTNAQEIKLYFAGQGGDETWEIRPLKSKQITGGNIVITVDAWMLIDPDLWETLPDGDGLAAIDISTDANFVTSVDVYREYADPTLPSVTFFWREPCSICGGSGCSACSRTSQTGCFVIVDAENGLIAPFPATYDADTATWVEGEWSNYRAPDAVQITYYAGDRDERYLRGVAHEPMRLSLIKAIAYMTTARLRGGLCGCPRISNLVDWLQEDVSRLSQGASFFTPGEILLNPFGVLRGEVLAYKACRKPGMRNARVALV